MVVSLNNNATGATSKAGTGLPFRSSEFTSVFVLFFFVEIVHVLLNLQFSVQCFVDHCLPFVLSVVWPFRAVVVVIVLLLDLQLPLQSVHITTNVTMCTRYNIM